MGCKKANVQPQAYVVDSATSLVEWKGATTDHSHIGSFQLEGTLSLSPTGQLAAGRFRIPISSITNFDLASPVKEQLLDHLKSADFFDLLRYPEAHFTITQVTAPTGESKEAAGDANQLITGELTLLGQTHPVSFPALVQQTGDSLKAQARLTIDRTKWGMTHYSNPQEPMYILPDAEIFLHLQAAKP